MKILSNCHTHSVFCDGRDTPAEMAETACQMGFVSLGFSGHSANSTDTEWCMKDTEAYRREVCRLRDVYRGRMRIWLGVEWDYISPLDPADYEYSLGATHRMYCERGEIPVDHSQELLDKLVVEYLKGDGEALYRGYYENVKKAAIQRSPIFAHFDLVRKFNDGKRYFDTEAPAYRKCALDALNAVFHSGAVLEINTGGMSRGATQTPYPDFFLLDAWHEMGGEVILGSDCHDRRYLDFAFPQALDLARRAGYTQVCRLGVGSELLERVKI